MASITVQVAGASRPYPGEDRNGDAWLADCHGGIYRITVIDALGHGSLAADVAAAAVTAVAARPELSAVETLRLCQQVLSGTRGAAISVATIEPEAGRLLYAGIGNVEAQVLQVGKQQRPICYRGIVGVTAQTVRAFELPLVRPWTLIMHTDGVSSHLVQTALTSEPAGDPQSDADAILARWARDTDDATVVVARCVDR